MSNIPPSLDPSRRVLLGGEDVEIRRGEALAAASAVYGAAPVIE